MHISGAEAGSKLKVLGNGKARLDGIQVPHIGDAGGMGGAVGQSILPIPQQTASGSAAETSKQAKQCRFARAVRARKHEGPTRRDSEGDIAQHQTLAAEGGQGVGFQHSAAIAPTGGLASTSACDCARPLTCGAVWRREPMAESSFLYVIYTRMTREKLRQALATPEFTKQY
jgi:hypothetical protein